MEFCTLAVNNLCIQRARLACRAVSICRASCYSLLIMKTSDKLNVSRTLEVLTSVLESRVGYLVKVFFKSIIATTVSKQCLSKFQLLSTDRVVVKDRTQPYTT